MVAATGQHAERTHAPAIPLPGQVDRSTACQRKQVPMCAARKWQCPMALILDQPLALGEYRNDSSQDAGKTVEPGLIGQRLCHALEELVDGAGSWQRIASCLPSAATVAQQGTLPGGAGPIDHCRLLPCPGNERFREGRAMGCILEDEPKAPRRHTQQPAAADTQLSLRPHALAKHEPLVGYRFAACDDLFLFERPTDHLSHVILERRVERVDVPEGMA